MSGHVSVHAAARRLFLGGHSHGRVWSVTLKRPWWEVPVSWAHPVQLERYELHQLERDGRTHDVMVLTGTDPTAAAELLATIPPEVVLP